MSNRFPLQTGAKDWLVEWALASLNISTLCLIGKIVTILTSFIIFGHFKLKNINYMWASTCYSVRNILILSAGKLR